MSNRNSSLKKKESQVKKKIFFSNLTLNKIITKNNIIISDQSPVQITSNTLT